ncbi:MAG: hypothetical protein PHF29_00080 [Candidatus Riflebacteria bacterium]|nr:hypothetical protein [Candidatus Riflebacteria bacterium]
MNKIIKISTIFCLVTCLLSFQKATAEESWQRSVPGEAKIGNSISIKQEHVEMHVPSSLSGREVKDLKTVFRADISKIARFTHRDSDIDLKGRSTRMNMEFKKDILDFQIFKSRQNQSGASSCMDCHGAEMPRTIVTAGIEKTKAEASPYAINGAVIKLFNAEANAFRGELNHWMKDNLMLKLGLKNGTIEQGKSKLDANSFTIGLGGYISNKTSWSGELNISKVETYEQRKTLIGRLDYKLSEGLKIVVGGGAFLDGYTQFDTEFAEMGMLINGVVKDTNKLPDLFNRLKNDRFGYWNIGIEYEIKL